MKLHPITELVPPMSAEEYKELVADIKKNGLREPVWTYKGEVIDGRHRVTACRDAGVKVQTRQWKGKREALPAFVVSLNLKRRNLTASERAAIGVELLDFFKKEAKERQRAHGGTAPGKKAVHTPGKNAGGEAREQAAAAVGVSPRMISDAATLKEEDPVAYQAVRQGKIKVHKARRQNARKDLSEAQRIERGYWLLNRWLDQYHSVSEFEGIVAYLARFLQEKGKLTEFTLWA